MVAGVDDGSDGKQLDEWVSVYKTRRGHLSLTLLEGGRYSEDCLRTAKLVYFAVQGDVASVT
jgi:hypothetical protein